MRRTIHSDPSRNTRQNRRQTRSILPSNFQFELEDKGEDMRVKRSSDGQRQRMVPVQEYDTLQADLTAAKAELAVTREALAASEERFETLEEDINTLREALLTLL